MSAEMRCDVATPEELGPSEQARWEEIRRASPGLGSPFFAYEFTRAVGAARPDARIAVLERDGRIAGFFPFHAGRLGVGRPIGTKLSDYQGALVDPSVEWAAPDLVRLAGLGSYAFEHVAAAQIPFRRFFSHHAVSPVVDLSRGYEVYHRERRAEGRAGTLREAARKRRRHPNIRFELHRADDDAFAALLRWKSTQYRRTKVFDVFSRRWVVSVLDRLYRAQTDELAGVLSCLYLDAKVVAVHFGLRSGPILHSWFPAYDTAHAKLSPGLVLLGAILEAAPSHGIATVDLGKGNEPYKAAIATGAIEVGEGSIHLGRARAAGAKLVRGAWSLPLRSPLYPRAHRLRQRLQLG